MYVDAKNVNYGYAVATHGKYVAAGNPTLVRYDATTASLYQTGSVDVFRYDLNTDQHLYVETLKKPFDPSEAILLAAETSSFIKSASLQTEPLGFDVVNRNKDLAVDEGLYIQNLENDYGHVVDWYNMRLAVGCRYYWDQVVIPISGSVWTASVFNTFDSSGSCVDIWDYTFTERNQYTANDPINMVGYGVVIGGTVIPSLGDNQNLDWRGYNTGSNNVFYTKYLVPAGYDEVWVYGHVVGGPVTRVSRLPVPVQGGYVTFFFDLSLPTFLVDYVSGYIQTSTKRFHIENPDPVYEDSFGHAVSINSQWVAIGSPIVSGSKGAVYIYENKCTGSNLSWSLHQVLAPTNLYANQLFGWDVSLNKSATFACPNRLVVGCGATNNPYVYLYELSASVWIETYRFTQNSTNLGSLTFDTSSFPILLASSYQTSSFGYSVSTWEDTVVIGAPHERQIQEFTGSAGYEQGVAYIFERCDGCGCEPPVTASTYRLAQKIYGDGFTLKNNRLGHSVSVYGDNMLIGIPKIDIGTMTSCFVGGAIPQQLYCNNDLQDLIHGQWMYLTRNTSSLEWENQKVFQKKKRFLSPYRCLSQDVSVGDQSVVVGAPILISNLARQINIIYTGSLGVALDDIMGKAYIYNIHNFKPQHYVGNVFYRNGTLVVNTSGSAFEGLYFNPTTPYTYEYLMKYKSRHGITEKQIACTVEPGEFNVSTNPTAIVKATSSFDLNQNGIFDFQDADVLLRYMQYKNSTTLGGYSFDWSSSIVKNDDEVSFYNFNAAQWTNTDFLFSSSLRRFENVDTWYSGLLDFNEDNKIDINDMSIMWKYFSNRLTEKNYLSYINSNCQRQQVNQAIIYLDDVSKRHATPMISPSFSDYDDQCCLDKTGSYQSPVVTTVGLYDGGDLVAVAKLGAPIKLPKTLPINFVVKMDF